MLRCRSKQAQTEIAIIVSSVNRHGAGGRTWELRFSGVRFHGLKKHSPKASPDARPSSDSRALARHASGACCRDCSRGSTEPPAVFAHLDALRMEMRK